MVVHRAGAHAGMEQGVKPRRSRWDPATQPARAEGEEFHIRHKESHRAPQSS